MAKAKTVKKDEKIKYTCTSCLEEKNDDNFYNSYSILYRGTKKMPVCKNCLVKLYESYIVHYFDEKERIYELCKLLDVYFDETVYQGALTQSNNKDQNLFRVYVQKVNSLNQYEGKTFRDSIPLQKLSDVIVSVGDFDVTKDMITCWGEGFSPKDYEFLENEYLEYINGYECDTPAMERLLRQASYESLEIRKKRIRGEDASKNLKTLQEILGSANIKPVQATGFQATEQATFGTLIKKWENEKPIPEPDPEFEDVDGIKKYIGVWFLGHLCKMLGIENSYSKMYEEEVARYTVDFQEDEEDGD